MSTATAAPAVTVPSPFCIIFAGLTDEGRVALIRLSHAEFLETLGKTMDAATLAEMAQNGDPFTLPEKARLKHDGLQKHLTEFKKLLERQGWLTPEIEQALLADLGQRRRSLEREAGTRVDAVRVTQLMQTVTFPGNVQNPTPDGRYVLVSDSPTTMRVYDLVEKRLLPESHSFPDHYAVWPGLSPAGDLYLPSKNGTFAKLPFKNGVPNMAAAVTLGAPAGFTAFNRMHFVNAQIGLAVGELDGALGLARFNLKSGAATPIDLAAVGKVDKSAKIDIVDGTEDFFVTKTFSNAGMTLRKFTVNAEGKAVPVPGGIFFKSIVGGVRYSKDGTSVFLVGHGITESETPTAWQMKHVELDQSPSSTQTVRAVVAHPDGNRAVTLVRDQGRTFLGWYDVKTGAELGRHEMLQAKDFADLSFSGDGKRFLIRERMRHDVLIGDVSAIEP